MRNRRFGLGLACAALLLAGCGPQAAQQIFEQPSCVATNNTLVLAAQAVPSASRIACVESYPTGWSLSAVDIEKGFERFWLRSDRAGDRAVEVVMTKTCPEIGTEIPSDEPGTRLLLDIDSLSPRFQGARRYLYSGACMTLLFNFPATDRTRLGTDATTAVGLLDRAELERELERNGFHL